MKVNIILTDLKVKIKVKVIQFDDYMHIYIHPFEQVLWFSDFFFIGKVTKDSTSNIPLWRHLHLLFEKNVFTVFNPKVLYRFYWTFIKFCNILENDMIVEIRTWVQFVFVRFKNIRNITKILGWNFITLFIIFIRFLLQFFK